MTYAEVEKQFAAHRGTSAIWLTSFSEAERSTPPAPVRNHSDPAPKQKAKVQAPA